MTSLSTTALRASLAFGLSFALWAFVSFSQNPEELVRFEDLTPQVVELGPGLVIVDANGLPNINLSTIDVTLRTDRTQRNELRPVDVRTVVDLTGLSAGEHIVPVNVQATRSTISFSVPNDGVSPSAVQIRLEELITTTVPIDLKINGNLPFSFERGEPEILLNGETISDVRVSGPQNRVERVVGAQIAANIEQLRASYQAPLTLIAVDETGQAVEGVEIEPTSVLVRIPITSVVGLKLVPVEANITGLPAAGYEVASIQIEPPLISLAGSSGPLDSVDVLQTQPIDLNGLSSSLAREAQIIFPTGTSPQSGEPSSVQVTVTVRRLSRLFQVQLPAQVSVVGLSGGFGVSLSSNIVGVALAGTNEQLDSLSQTTLRATVDVSGLGPGTYQLPVAVIVPEGISLIGDAPTVSVSLRLPPTNAPDPTDEPEPTVGTPPPANATPTPGGPPAGTPTTAPPSPTGESAAPTATPEPVEPTIEPTTEPVEDPAPEPSATPGA